MIDKERLKKLKEFIDEIAEAKRQTDQESQEEEKITNLAISIAMNQELIDAINELNKNIVALKENNIK